MRRFILGVAIATALAGPAAAQYGTTPYQYGFTTSVSPLGQLSAASLQWMVSETVRQAKAPTTLNDLDLAIEQSIGEDLAATAGHTHMTKADLASAMRYEIVKEARDLLIDDIKLRKKAKDQTSDDAQLAMQAAVSRKNRLDALVEQARRRLTRKGQDAVSD